MSEIIIKWPPREEQNLILDKFKRVVELKKQFFIIEAPTGTGKSLAIQMMANYYRSEIDKEATFDILTNTKLLQNQYLRDFGFIKSLQGKDNYFCSQNSCTCSEGQMINKLNNKSCNFCPYSDARNEYKKSVVGLLNFHLYVSLVTYVEDMIFNEREANILFLDEAHSFEEIYCDFINSYLSIPYIESLGINITDDLNLSFRGIRSKQDFANFLQVHIKPKIELKMKKIEESIKDSHKVDENKMNSLKEHRKLSRTKCKFNRFLNDEVRWQDNWTIETKTNKDGLYHKVDAVWGADYLKDIWSKYDMVVMLTGTVLDKQLFTRLLGANMSDCSFLTIQSPFPIKNRPIFFLDKGKMSYATMEESYNNMLPDIRKILQKYSKDKGIIHTGNYKLSEWIERDLKDSRLLFHDSKTKESILQKHNSSLEPTVLVSPSMTNGVDLKDELARFQIILKIPYPALDNEKIKLRMKQNTKWYSWRTMCELIQSYGRPVRSIDDYASTYILDSNFSTLTRQIKLPAYVQEAIVE